MNQRIIEETKEYFTTKFGAPLVSKMGTMTYRKLNPYLDNFIAFIDAIDRACTHLNYKLSEAQVQLLCNFAKSTEYINTYYVVKRLNSIMNRCDKGYAFEGKKKFIQLLDDLAQLSVDKKYDCSLLINNFVYSINCSRYSMKYRDIRYDWVKQENAPFLD